MGQSELTTAKYFEQAEQERARASEGAAVAEFADPAPRPSPADRWAGAYRWLSIGLAVAALACVLGLALPYLNVDGQRRNPIDWLLWFGGARSDQTFEKYLTKSAAASQREWEDRYRESPVYQFNSGQLNLDSLNFSAAGGHSEPAPRPRGKR